MYSDSVKTAEADSDDINSKVVSVWAWNPNDTHKLVVSCQKHDGTIINRFVDLDNDATTKQPLCCSDNNVSNWDNIRGAGWYSGIDAANAPTSGWISAINIPYNNSSAYPCLIATNGLALFIRRKDGNLGWSNWLKIG